MKTFLTILLILLLLRMLLKPFIKFTVVSTVNKMADEMRKEQEQFYRQNQKPEGTISIDNVPDKKKGNQNKNGDYVDFEEVK